MEICIAVILYFVIGAIINELYRERDIQNSIEVDAIIYEMSSGDPVKVAKLEMETVWNSGYYFWRRRTPFSKWSWAAKYLFGLLIWPADLLMSEIGYKKELKYLKGE